MKSFSKVLNTFEAIMQEFNPLNYLKLQQPLSEAVVNDHFVKMGISDPDVRALYQWRNGINVDTGVTSEDYIFSDGVLVSLEYAIHLFELDKDEFDHLIPIILNIDGGNYCSTVKRGKDMGSCIAILRQNFVLADNVYLMTHCIL